VRRGQKAAGLNLSKMAELPKDKTFGMFGFFYLGGQVNPMKKKEVTNDTGSKNEVSKRFPLDIWAHLCLWCLSNDDVDLAIRMGMGASSAGV
jgi:hypothetical protein